MEERPIALFNILTKQRCAVQEMTRPPAISWLHYCEVWFLRRREPWLGLGGKKRYAKADVCIVEGTDPLLIVQQDKSHMNLGGDADSRLIATAIAAYDKDSLHRLEYGLPARSGRRRVVGIVMSGSWPTSIQSFPYPGWNPIPTLCRILVASALRKKSYWLIASPFRGPNSGWRRARSHWTTGSSWLQENVSRCCVFQY